MFINNFDPVAIQIFSIEIRWYSLAYIIGILLGWILSKRFFISNVELKEKFDDFLTFVILGIIIGGRLGYVILYNPNYYLDNLLDIFKIWEGGMSFHGGLIGVVLASIYFAKKNNQNLILKKIDKETVNLQVTNNEMLVCIVGQFDQNLKNLSKLTNTVVYFRGNSFFEGSETIIKSICSSCSTSGLSSPPIAASSQIRASTHCELGF